MSTHKYLFAVFAAVIGGVFGLSLTLGAPMVSAQDAADTNGDGFISTAEGVPFYGGVVNSLTTTGSTSAESVLDLDRFPVANANGNYSYERTFDLSSEVDELSGVSIVVHGEDLNSNDMYDGTATSSIADDVPFEATVPVACGVVEMGDDEDQYEVELDELNMSGASGNATIEHDGDEVTVEMDVFGVSADMAHAQHFHFGEGGECPPNIGDDGADGDDETDEENETVDALLDEIRELIEELDDRVQELARALE